MNAIDKSDCHQIVQMGDLREQLQLASIRPIPLWPPKDPGVKSHRRGTHRTVAPAATVARVECFVERMGVTRVANVTGLDRVGLPAVLVCRPNSRSVAVSMGKGLDLDAAKASGLMESAETYHAERIDLPLKYGSANDLRRTHRLVEVEALPGLRDSRFHTDLPMLWIEGHDLLSEESVWLPYETVHANHTLPLPPGSGCFPCSSNGLASGNHLLEAICHGLGELIERDATSLWRARPTSLERTRIDLSTVDDPACCTVLKTLADAGLGIAVWETTTDIGIPSFYCILNDELRKDGHRSDGEGCHLEARIALLRAMLEAVQVRAGYITGARDDKRASEYGGPMMAIKARNFQTMMARSPSVRDFRAIPTRSSDTFREDIDWILARLAAVNIREVVVVDLTRDDIGLPVVRAVIPGLEGRDEKDSYVAGPRARAARSGRS